MGWTRDDLKDLVRSHGLAACCVIGPIVFGLLLVIVAAGELVPRATARLPLSYKFMASAPACAPAGANVQPQQSERSPAVRAIAAAPGAREGAPANAQGKPSDPCLLSVANNISGRYGYAVASSFLWLAAAASFVFGLAIVLSRLPTRLVVAALVVFSAIAWLASRGTTPYEWADPLLLQNLLDKADDETVLKPLIVGRGTGTAAARLVGINTVVSLIGVGMVLLALYALSVRPAPSDLAIADLKRRLTGIRCALGLGSAILVIAVLASKTLLDWPLTLLIDEQKNALSPLADALTFLLGGTGSIALIAAFAPAIVAWTLDAELYKSTQAQSAVQSPATQAGGSAAAGVPGSDLVFAPMPMIASVLVILAPVLTSPFVDGLRAILPLVGGKPG